MWYKSAMTKDQVKAVLDRVLSWPKQRQEDAAEMLKLIEAHDNSPYRLTPEQAEEVRQRLADKSATTLTLSQLDERLRRLGV
jgi:hypothetical protein